MGSINNLFRDLFLGTVVIMNAKELLKEAQDKRQELINKLNESQKQRQVIDNQVANMAFEIKELDGEIKAYTLMMGDNKDGSNTQESS